MTFKPNLLSLIILLIICASCRKNENHEFQTVDFEAFQVDLSKTWRVVDLKGIDSHIKAIVTEDGDTLQFDYGFYSGALEEESLKVYPANLRKIFIERGRDTTGFIFLDKEIVSSSDLEPYRKQRLENKIIDGFRASIMTPKKPGTGITGVYFDSLGNGPIGNIQLRFSGNNLKPKNSVLFLKSINTIRISRDTTTSK
ncbi:hypothetical protein TH61_03260 [Rufibacter sp. DG15C]|nr:hypothetical protein TH61_03260 [Rufibacter sp. DG15C]